MSDDVLTRDNDGNLAVRTVSSTGDNYVNPDDVYTRDSEGKLCVRTTGQGGGGGDQHNLGWYATQSALETAHPTATAGDWAIVGSTDTVWIWDTDTNAWKDSDQKGQVTSVNGQTGEVVLDLLPSQTGQSGKFLTTDGTDASWGTISALQNTATGTDSLTILGTATIADYAVNIGVGSVSSNEGDVAIGYNAQANGGQEYSTAVGFDARAVAPKSVALGASTQVGNNANGSVVIGSSATATKSYSVSIGNYAGVTGWGAIQLGGYDVTNSEAGTFYVGLTPNNSSDTVNYKLLDSNGTIPTARLTKVNSTITLTAAGWSNGSQTVNVTGMTATGVVLVSPDPTDQADYTSAGIICSAQASGTLTFSCDSVPSGDIDVVVVML